MFIERDEAGRIKGVYAQRQGGYAEEELPDDYSEVLAYLNPPKDYAQLRREEYNRRGVTIEALVVAMFEKNAAEIQRLEALRAQVKQDFPKPDNLQRV